MKHDPPKKNIPLMEQGLLIESVRFWEGIDHAQ